MNRPILAAGTLLLAGLVASSSAMTDAPAAERDYCALAPLESARREELEATLANRTGSLADARADAALELAGHAIAAAATSERRCRRAFDKGASTFERVLAKKTRSVTGNAGEANSDDPAIRGVQTQLRGAFITDQAARLTYLELATDDRTGADYWARRLATAHAIRRDAANTQLLSALLEDLDWVDAHRFGLRIASHAWLIVQHADADPDFQREVLGRMAPYLDNGGVRARDYAYLFDRVAVNSGELQRYGTQPQRECNDDGSLSPRPLEDPERVDERRAELGMEPMAEAMATMAAGRCRQQ